MKLWMIQGSIFFKKNWNSFPPNSFPTFNQSLFLLKFFYRFCMSKSLFCMSKSLFYMSKSLFCINLEKKILFWWNTWRKHTTLEWSKFAMDFHILYGGFEYMKAFEWHPDRTKFFVQTVQLCLKSILFTEVTLWWQLVQLGFKLWRIK